MDGNVRAKTASRPDGNSGKAARIAGPSRGTTLAKHSPMAFFRPSWRSLLRSSLATLCALGVTASAVAEENETRRPRPDQPLVRHPDPPRLMLENEMRVALPTRPGVALRIPIQASGGDDRTTLVYDVRPLPPGARLEQPGEPGKPAEIVWPSAESGSYVLDVSVSDGVSTTRRTVTLEVDEDWNSASIPGLGYSLYAPGKGPMVHGPSMQLVFAAWIHKNENRGPSHGRVHLDLDLLFPVEGGGSKSTFAPALGFDLSLERNPRRRFLLPMFGMAMGLLVRNGASTIGTITPQAGLYLYASPNVFIFASGGYLLPLSSAGFDDRRGARGLVGIDFSLW
jgi:hypothetical protein